VKHRRFAALIAMLSLALGAGCSFLSPKPDPTEFYVLTAIAAADSTTPTQGGASHLAIGLGPV
jgi:hypothetical protein